MSSCGRPAVADQAGRQKRSPRACLARRCPMIELLAEAEERNERIARY